MHESVAQCIPFRSKIMMTIRCISIRKSDNLSSPEMLSNKTVRAFLARWLDKN